MNVKVAGKPAPTEINVAPDFSKLLTTPKQQRQQVNVQADAAGIIATTPGTFKPAINVTELNNFLTEQLGRPFKLESRLTPQQLQEIRNLPTSPQSLSPRLTAQELERLQEFLAARSDFRGFTGFDLSRPTFQVLNPFQVKQLDLQFAPGSQNTRDIDDLLDRSLRLTGQTSFTGGAREKLKAQLLNGTVPTLTYTLDPKLLQNLQGAAPPDACTQVQEIQVADRASQVAYRTAVDNYGVDIRLDPTAEPVGGQGTAVGRIQTMTPAARSSSWSVLSRRNYGVAGQPTSQGLQNNLSVYLLDSLDAEGADDPFRRTVKLKSSESVEFVGHGIHLKEIIMAIANVPKEAFRIVPVCDGSGCSTAKVIMGVCQAAAEKISSPGRRVLVNMSFSTPLPGQFLQEVMKFAASKGVVFLAAHGNAPRLTEDAEITEESPFSCAKYVKDDRCHHFPGDWAYSSRGAGAMQGVYSVSAASCTANVWSKSSYTRADLPADRAQSLPPSVYFPGSWPFPIKLNGQETYANYNGTSFATAVATSIMIRNGDLNAYARLNGRC
ncbi:S8 family serine peptidase [Deinococcus depolymerans]|uniref:S8 family serine peptidase n=1 Tax=Deinococcus depolymerans TaxID=392408 RepID=UPI0031DDB013